jgi:HlyD family secretion protein
MKLLIILIMLCSLSACGHDKTADEKTKIITVKPHRLSTALYYSGIVQPLKTVIITTPAEGVVSDMAFHYGDVVALNQPLFTISSDKFQSDYKTALMGYIKAKTDFTNNQMQLRESDFLHKNQLISDDEFKSKQTGFFNAQLALIQAKDALAIYLKQMDLKGIDLFSLSIEDIDKIKEVLHVQNDSQVLHIASPAAGVVLLPIKNDSNEGQTKKIVKGDQVKQGEVLAMIGDVSGLTIHVNVNEFNINQLKIGQSVTVSGTAFSEFELAGEISGIDRQGQASQGGVPVFPVEIIVPKLTAEQQKVIHIGMSAKVDVRIEGSSVITVPIAAVVEKNGLPYVRVTKNGKTQEVLVKTGQTTQDEVVIEQNLKVGDQVVVIG